MHLHDWLLHAERFAATRPALIEGEARRTYAETASRVRRAAAGLRGLGLQLGDRVAVAAENGILFYEAYFACSLAGLVAVPLNIRLSSPEIAFILEDSGSAALLYDDACAPLAEGQTGVHLLPAAQWQAMIAASEPLTAAPHAGDQAALAHLCYTGGTTGRPKGVMLSHGNVMASATNKNVLGQFRRDDVWLHAAPMFHQADSWACFSSTALGARSSPLPLGHEAIHTSSLAPSISRARSATMKSPAGLGRAVSVV